MVLASVTHGHANIGNKLHEISSIMAIVPALAIPKVDSTLSQSLASQIMEMRGYIFQHTSTDLFGQHIAEGIFIGPADVM